MSPIDPFFTSAVKVDAWTPRRKRIKPTTGERFSSIPPLGERLEWYRRIYLWSPYWRRLRKRKLAVSPLCEDCGSKDRPDVHHIVYGDLWNVSLAHLRTLCRDCHDKRHRNKSRALRLERARSLSNAMTIMDDIKRRRKHFEQIRQADRESTRYARVKRKKKRWAWCSEEKWRSTQIRCGTR